MATVLVTLGSHIGVPALTRLGSQINAVLIAEIVRDGNLDIGISSLLTREAAIHSFSNLYHCGWNNRSAAGLWCCGAEEGTPEGRAGCCNTTLINPVFTGAFAHTSVSELNDSATNTSASSPTRNISSPGTSNAVPSSPRTSLTASKPQQRSHERVAIGLGVGIPLGLIASTSLLLLFREHKLRLRAESMAGILNGERITGGERRDQAIHGSQGHNALQELPDERKHPNELDSRQVYEVAVHGKY